MARSKLNPGILEALTDKTKLSEKTIRNNISKLRREDPILTHNAAAQVFAEKRKAGSFMPKMDDKDRISLSSHQQARSIVNNNKFYSKNHSIDHSINLSDFGYINNLAIGDNNNQQSSPLEEALVDLANKIGISQEISNQDKSDLAADIGTILSQSKKTSPDKDIIKKSWFALNNLSKIAGLASSLATVYGVLCQTGLL